MSLHYLFFKDSPKISTLPFTLLVGKDKTNASGDVVENRVFLKSGELFNCLALLQASFISKKQCGIF